MKETKDCLVPSEDPLSFHQERLQDNSLTAEPLRHRDRAIEAARFVTGPRDFPRLPLSCRPTPVYAPLDLASPPDGGHLQPATARIHIRGCGQQAVEAYHFGEDLNIGGAERASGLGALDAHHKLSPGQFHPQRDYYDLYLAIQ